MIDHSLGRRQLMLGRGTLTTPHRCANIQPERGSGSGRLYTAYNAHCSTESARSQTFPAEWLWLMEACLREPLSPGWKSVCGLSPVFE